MGKRQNCSKDKGTKLQKRTHTAVVRVLQHCTFVFCAVLTFFISKCAFTTPKIQNKKWTGMDLCRLPELCCVLPRDYHERVHLAGTRRTTMGSVGYHVERDLEPGDQTWHTWLSACTKGSSRVVTARMSSAGYQRWAPVAGASG